MFSKDLFLILFQRSWQALSGFVTTILATIYLSPIEQGWYYTFLSIASLCILFELGLASALTQLSSHMFTKLKWGAKGEVLGEQYQKFNSFFFHSVTYFVKASSLFFVVITLIGYLILDNKAGYIEDGFHWVQAWVLLVFLTALNLVALPFISVVEGSGKIKEVYSLKLAQGFLGSVFCWLALVFGVGIWCALMLPLSAFVVFIIWLVIRKPALLNVWLDGSKNHFFDWSKEVMPLQWRVGVGWVSVYLMSQLTVPLVFYFFDPALAGRIGLCLTVAHTVGILSQSWIARHIPKMSQAVANKDWDLFDIIFRRDIIFSLFFFIAVSLALLNFYAWAMETKYSVRLLPTDLFCYLLVFVFFHHINTSFAAHLRSFKKEPLIWLFLVGAIMTVILTIYAAKLHSINGVIYSMCLVQVILVFPCAFWMWKKHNNLLRAEMVGY
jgi:O-antigen/teichoic acid export membrane protein